ncbi:uncharacterized protein H6S33_010014 [Morchella sextelata]|uniref:uncharacterized protein n=1 Tax=Morchella sextelata TaxID=1174677 RepID=UPI001D055E3F|nr:uncharacterized protein H6S33_010014 [Morchella sextelata]KAH0611962.1 hypothetical protein H6S33_010014 [Morchella sextelata]
MSFLTLFTANAAAAHGHEFSGPTSPSGLASCALQMLNPNAQQSPRTSITTAPVPAPVAASSPIFEEIPTPPPPPPKKLPRSKSSYHLAQPPPGSHHTFKPSRSLVVQLQKLSNTTRPLPTLDVLPASVFAPRLKRKLGKFFGNGVGMQDLVFLSSEDFGHDEDEDDDEDSLNARQVVASVSSGYRKMDGEDGKGSRITVIQLSSGPQWEVSTTAAGGYEFVAHDEDGGILMARWNPKSANPRRRSYQTTKSETGEEEKRFQFSLVNPNSRKHPILGSLTKQTIEINDTYPLPSISSPLGSPLASPATTPPHSRPGTPTTSSPLGVAFQISDERIMVKTSEHMRSLMLVSGIWIALREGLVASSMRLDDPSQPHYPLTPSSSLFPGGRLSPAYNRPSIASRSVSDPAGGKGAHDEHTLRRPRRTGTLLAHDVTTNHHRHSAPPPGEAGSLTPPRRANSLGGAQPRDRAHSTGVLRNFGRASPVMERSRAGTPEAPIRVPVPPTTPPTVGCIHRSFKGHRHTNSVSLPNSPAKHREKQKQAASTTPSEETRKSEREKRKWGRRISGLFDTLRRSGSTS